MCAINFVTPLKWVIVRNCTFHQNNLDKLSVRSLLGTTSGMWVMFLPPNSCDLTWFFVWLEFGVKHFWCITEALLKHSWSNSGVLLDSFWSDLHYFLITPEVISAYHQNTSEVVLAYFIVTSKSFQKWFQENDWTLLSTLYLCVTVFSFPVQVCAYNFLCIFTLLNNS